MYVFKLKKRAALVILSALTIGVYGQQPAGVIKMSLDECLAFAKGNSITLEQAQLEIENNSADQLSAKGAFLPSVSAHVGQSFNSNPANTDPLASKSSYTGSYGVDLSMTLYNGGKNRSQLQRSRLGGEIAALSLSESANTIEVSVTEVYVEILYAMEQIEVAKTSLELGAKSLARGGAFLEAGSINSVDYAQLESAQASYEYDLIVAQTQLSNLYVRLKHLLEISQEVSLEVVVPETEGSELSGYIPTVGDVYSSALDGRPEIASAVLDIEYAELGEKVAKAGYLPSLNLTAGTGLNHNSLNNYTLSGQLRNNFNTSAGVSLSVPIFSRFSNRSSVSQAQNSIKSAELNRTQREKTLYQTIETLYNNAATAQSKFTVAKVQLSAAEKSLTLTTQQYDLGMKNIIDLLTEQDKYNNSRQSYITNKYQLILNKALLNYYQTNIIKL